MGVISIGATDFIKGVSVSDDLSDGGFSPLDKGQNLYHTPGLLKGNAHQENISANSAVLLDRLWAVCHDKSTAPGSSNRLFLVGKIASQANGARFYKVNNIGEISIGTGLDSSSNIYNATVTDIEYFGGSVYVSSNVDVAQVSTSLATVDPDWWSTRSGGAALAYDASPEVFYPHRLLQFDKKLYITDKYNLRYTDGTTVFNANLDISGDFQTITDIAIYEPTGDMLVATSPNALGQATVPESKILVWDGFSSLPSKEIRVRGEISCMYNLGGITYVFYDNKFGYFNGNGITFLRQLNHNDASVGAGGRCNKSMVAYSGDTLLFAEKNSVLAYGKLYPRGDRVFYYPFTQTNNITVLKEYGLQNISNIGVIERIWISDNNGASSVERSISLDDVIYGTTQDTFASSASSVRSNKYYLPSNSRIRKIEILFETLVSGDDIEVNYFTSSAPSTATELGDITFSTDGAISQKTFRGLDIETAYIQIQLDWVSGNTGIKQIRIYYDAIEKPV